MDPRRVLGALALGATLACATSSGTSGATSQPSGGGSLDISLPNISGEIIDVEAEATDEIFVLVFWATWCQPCQQELTKLNALHGERASRGLRIIAISIDGPDTAPLVGPWVQREGYEFPVLLDRETRILGRYNPRGDIPFYVVLDARGSILKDHQGYVTGDMDELSTFLDGVMRPG